MGARNTLHSNSSIAFHKHPDDPANQTELQHIGASLAPSSPTHTQPISPNNYCHKPMPTLPSTEASNSSSTQPKHNSITTSNNRPLANHAHPQHVLLLLDIVNMFNKMSWECAKVFSSLTPNVTPSSHISLLLSSHRMASKTFSYNTKASFKVG